MGTHPIFESDFDCLTVLCLHGYRQSGEQFRVKTGAFRKLLKKKCEYTFIDAPHIIADGEEDRGWWFSTSDDNYMATEKSAIDTGFEATLNHVEQVLTEQGPFDGILAFSQGACLAAILCSIKNKRNLSFHWAILAAGYRSRTDQHAHYYLDEIYVPTLHIIGESDQVIPRPMSDELLSAFDAESAKVARHEAGHILPTKGETKKQIVDFINELHQKKNS